MTTGIDKAIKAVQRQIYDDRYYNGARAVQIKAYQYADRRLRDAIAVTEDERSKEMLRAVWRGVLADIVNAGDEVLREENL